LNDTSAEIRALLKRDRGNYRSRLFSRYVMGNSSWGILPEDRLRAELEWDDQDTKANEVRLSTIKGELQATDSILVQQFSKISGLIALLGFIIAIGLAREGDGKSLTLKVVCLAAAYAVWAQSPRLKVLFHFHKREDAGLRTGAITTQWDAYYYTYKWLVRREHTTNAVETLVIVASLFTIVALGFVMFTV
jgi:hypothetical protein